MAIRGLCQSEGMSTQIISFHGFTPIEQELFLGGLLPSSKKLGKTLNINFMEI